MQRMVVAVAVTAWVVLAGGPAAAQELTVGGGLRGQRTNLRGYWGTASVAPVDGSCLAGTVHVTGSRWAEPEQETAVLGGVTCQARGRRVLRPFVQALAGAANDPRPEVQGLLARIDWSVGVDVRVDASTWVRGSLGLRSLLHADIGPGVVWSVGLVRAVRF